MSEKLCTLRTKGGGGGAKQEETVLWTNSNPTDSSGFANQDVTLSDSLTDYDYVKIRYAYAYNDTGSTFESVYSVSEFVKTSAPVTFGFSGCTNVTHRSNSYFYDRRIIYKTATSITFGSCMGYKASTAAAVSNIFNIPLSIVGIKHMYGKMEHYATGYFTTGLTSVDLGFVPKYVFCANGAPSTTSPNSTAQIYDANVSTTQYHMFGGDVDEMRNIGTIGSANQFCMEGTVIGMNPNQNFSLFKNSKRYYWAIG